MVLALAAVAALTADAEPGAGVGGAEVEFGRVEPGTGPDPVAELLSRLAEEAARSEPIPTPPPPPTPTPPPALPSVSAAPPAAIAVRFDGRSLVLGAIAGLVLGVGLSLLNRNAGGAESVREEEPSEPPGPATAEPSRGSAEGQREPGPSSAHETDAAAGSSIPPSPRPPQRAEAALVSDLLAMIQRLDERSARGDARLAGLCERVDGLDRRVRAQHEELASQRLAVARLERALGRPPVRLAADPARPVPSAARRSRER
jgi:hypothetical protein